MNHPLRLRLAGVALAAAGFIFPGAAGAAPASTTKPAVQVDASTGAPKTGAAEARFLQLHRSFLDRAKAGPIGLLFLGDSITYQWIRAPEVWKNYYGKYQPANFGIGADMTQHVIWRIEHGELDGIDPRVVVLLIGTNNSATNPAAEIIAANTKIVNLIRQKLPNTKILLLGIFPRGPRSPDKNGKLRDDGVTRMAVITAANAGLAKLDDGKHVRFLDLSPEFLDAAGKIPDELMPDQLHPSEKGYAVWAKAMDPLLTSMMGK